MTIWEAIILGLIQGITEFLPISSSGHLFLAAELFDLEADLGFFVFLHLGTLVAVVAAYWDVILKMLRNPKDYRWKFVVLASIPTFILAAFYKFAIAGNFEIYLLPVGFAATIVLLATAQRAKVKNIAVIPKTHVALLTGLAQGFAVIPGLSRSGTTISAMNLMGINRKQAGELSFLMSIPVILGGGAVETISLFREETISLTSPLNILARSAAAALSGLLAIFALKKLLSKDCILPFAVYLLIPLLLSVLCLI